MSANLIRAAHGKVSGTAQPSVSGQTRPSNIGADRGIEITERHVAEMQAMLVRLQFDPRAAALTPKLPTPDEFVEFLEHDANKEQLFMLKLANQLDTREKGARDIVINQLESVFQHTHFDLTRDDDGGNAALEDYGGTRYNTPLASTRRGAAASPVVPSGRPMKTKRLVPGIRNNTLQRLDRWILATPTNKTDREISIRARQSLVDHIQDSQARGDQGKRLTDAEIRTAWDDIFHTMSDTNFSADVLSALRNSRPACSFLADRFVAVTADCACGECYDAGEHPDPDAGALYSRLDLDDEDLIDAQFFERYNEQFDQTPSRPAPSVRATLLKKAAARRTGDGGITSMGNDSLLDLYGMRKPHSSTPLYQLEPIRFRDMQVPKSHKGSYLLCRIISRPSEPLCTHLRSSPLADGFACSAYRKCVHFVVEDQDGRAESLCLYNTVHDVIETGRALDELYKLGQALVIREPTFVRAVKGPTITLRVDSPTDVTFLPLSASLLQEATWTTESPSKHIEETVEWLRIQGNKAFSGGQHELAVRAYSAALALEPTPEERLVLALNRAAAYLRLRRYASGFRDASIVLAYLEQGVAGPPAAQSKALMRRATALHYLRQWHRALEDYSRLLELDPNQPTAVKNKAAVETAIGHSKTGVYFWNDIKIAYDLAAETKSPPLDLLPIGDFVGPIEVRKMPHRAGGRGVVATRDIKAGEVVLGEAAWRVI